MFNFLVIRRFAFAALPLLVLAGCAASPEQQVAGNYVADPNRIVIPEIPKIPGVSMTSETIKKSLGAMSLKLRSDKTYVLSSGPGSTEGTWVLNEKGVVLTPKNAPAAAPKTIELTRDVAKNELSMSQTLPIGKMKFVLVKNGS